MEKRQARTGSNIQTGENKAKGNLRNQVIVYEQLNESDIL